MNQDVYFKKVIPYRFYRREMKFAVSQDLFSSHDIDTGTRMLLKTLGTDRFKKHKTILDLGCGYGVIGLSLQSLDRDRTVHLTDRDALALDYTRQNAVLNDLTDTEVYESLGYDNVKKRDFDLIVSNIPAKAGEAVITSMLLDSQNHLSSDGMVAIVVVKPLEEFVSTLLTSTPNITIHLKEKGIGHTVFHYQFSRVSERVEQTFEDGIYDRAEVVVSKSQITTVYGLPEFDTPSYATQLLLEALQPVKDVSHAICFNPGQGHMPVSVLELLRPQTISLVDRDLLALKNSQRNLLRNGYEEKHMYHQIGIEIAKQCDLIVGVLREDEGREAVMQTVGQGVEQLISKGKMIIAGSSTAITRVLSSKIENVKVNERKKWRGYSVLTLTKI